MGGLNVTNAAATNSATSEQDSKNSNSRKSNLNYRFHFLESDEDDMLSAGSSAAAEDRSGGEMCGGGGGGGGDENTHAGAAYKFGRYREGTKPQTIVEAGQRWGMGRDGERSQFRVQHVGKES